MPATSILVTGATGQLGQELVALEQYHPEFSMTFADRKDIDFSQPKTITQFFSDKSFDIVINCAAYTSVDKAESEPELANAINHKAVAALAEAVKKTNGQLIHISTDYVFDGCQHRPYREDDNTAPQTVYGASKRLGEEAIVTAGTRGIIIRTSWVYSQFGNNFVKTMLRLGREREQLKVIFDQVGSPTYAHDLAAALLHICAHPALTTMQGETFHYSNEGVASWYDFAYAIFTHTNIPCQILPIETKDYPTPAQRPHYSLLNKHKIKTTFELPIKHWRCALNDFFDTTINIQSQSD